MKARKWIRMALGLGLLVFAGLALSQVWGYYRSESTTRQAQALAGIPAVTTPVQTNPETTPAGAPAPSAPEETRQAPQSTSPVQAPLAEEAQFLLELELGELQQVNADVLGWIHLPGTQVSYPLLRSEDNAEYLKKSWDGSYSRAGSIFLECQNSPDLKDFNTIIYGHHMGNGSCFADLVKFRQEEYALEHTHIYIVLPGELRRYRIFAAYEAGLESDTYRMHFTTTQRRQKAISYYLEQSVWEAPVQPITSSPIVTLSTCTGTGTYDTRWVVQGVLTGIWER